MGRHTPLGAPGQVAATEGSGRVGSAGACGIPEALAAGLGAGVECVLRGRGCVGVRLAGWLVSGAGNLSCLG